MSERSGQLVAAIVVALVLGAGIGWWRGSRDADKAGDDLAAMEARIAQLEAQRAVDAPRSTSASRPQSPATATDAGIAPLPPTPAMSEAQRRARTERFNAGLAAAFAAQAAAPARDPVPARIDEAFVDAGVLAAESLPESQDVSCRATMCLVRAHFAPGASSADWTNRMLLQIGDVLPSASATEIVLPDGSTELRIYASRVGERAPVEWVEGGATR